MTLAVSDLRRQSHTPPGVVAVLRALAQLAPTERTPVAVADIAATAGVTTRTVQRAIRVLQESGRIRVDAVRGGVSEFTVVTDAA